MRILKDWYDSKNWLEAVGWCWNWCRKSSWTILNPIQAGRTQFDCKIQQKHTVSCSRSSVRGQIISGPNLNQPYHIGINASNPSEAIWGHLGPPPAPFFPLEAVKANWSCSRSSVRAQIISGPNLNQPYHIGIYASNPSEAIWGHLGPPPSSVFPFRSSQSKLIML